MEQTKQKQIKRVFGFGQRVFIIASAIFIAYALFFIIYQSHRERTYKTDLLNAKLQAYNMSFYEGTDTLDAFSISTYLRAHPINKLRLTIIRRDGKVLFDNDAPNTDKIENHLNRMEVQKALKHGQGFDIYRRSHTLAHPFFYSATYFKSKGIVVRTALPYTESLDKMLQTNNTFIWITIILSLLILTLLLKFSRSLSKNINELKDFAQKAEHNQIDEQYIRSQFPSNEMEEISHYIMRLYIDLKESRQDKTRLKKQLTQNIAHELKTPVSCIQGYLETIIEKSESIDTQTKDKFIHHAYTQTERLTSLINDISMLNKMEDGTKLLSDNCVLVNLYETADAIGKELALPLSDKNMTFNNLLPADTVITANPTLIYSIIKNLLDNAIAYAGQGSTVTLKRCDSSNPDFYVFTFYDNGIGVPSEHLIHLFERFYRIDKGRSRKNGGTGLGLAIVKNAVLFHGGDIKAYDQIGGGLAFDFSLKKTLG